MSDMKSESVSDVAHRAVLLFARFFKASVLLFNVATTSCRPCSSAGCPSGAGSSTTVPVAFFALANCLEGILAVCSPNCPDGSFRLAVENFVEAIFRLAVENLRDGIFDIEFFSWLRVRGVFNSDVRSAEAKMASKNLRQLGQLSLCVLISAPLTYGSFLLLNDIFGDGFNPWIGMGSCLAFWSFGTAICLHLPKQHPFKKKLLDGIGLGFLTACVNFLLIVGAMFVWVAFFFVS